MALLDGFKKWMAGRLRHEPQRDTQLFPRLLGIGQYGIRKGAAVFRPTAPTLRYFSHTPFARKAINTIKNPIALLDWEIVPTEKAGKSPSRELEAQCELVQNCLEKPNTSDSFRSLIEQVIEDYLCVGAGAIEQQIGGKDIRPWFLWPVDAQSIQIFPLWDGVRNEPRYLQTTGYGNMGGLEGVKLRNDELIYIRPNPSSASPYGYSALEIAFHSISRKLGVEEYAGNLTANATPENMFVMAGYDDQALQAFRNYWRNEVEGQGQIPTAGVNEKDAIAVLKLRGSDDKALYLGYQEFLIREIAQAFDLSPQNLGIEHDVNRNVSEVAEDRDWNSAIKPCATNIASYINRDGIQGKLGFSQIEFRWKGLDREDEEATSKIYETYFKNNMLTPDEHREKLGMPPMDGEWGEMTYADMQIAIAAAKGAAAVLDDDLPEPKGGAKPKPAKSKSKPKAE